MTRGARDWRDAPGRRLFTATSHTAAPRALRAFLSFLLHLPFASPRPPAAAAQAVHAPYDLPPAAGGGTCAANATNATCAGALADMLRDSDVWLGAIVGALRAKQMWDDTLLVCVVVSTSLPTTI